MRGPLYAPWFCLKSMKPRPRLCSPFRAHVSGFLSGHFKSGQWKTVLEREGARIALRQGTAIPFIIHREAQ